MIIIIAGKLRLEGIRANITTVSLTGSGDFIRVRVSPVNSPDQPRLTPGSLTDARMRWGCPQARRRHS